MTSMRTHHAVFLIALTFLCILTPVLSAAFFRGAFSAALESEKEAALLMHERVEDHLLVSLREAELTRGGMPLTETEFREAVKSSLPVPGFGEFVLVKQDEAVLTGGFSEEFLPELPDAVSGTGGETEDASAGSAYDILWSESEPFKGKRETDTGNELENSDPNGMTGECGYFIHSDIYADLRVLSVWTYRDVTGVQDGYRKKMFFTTVFLYLGSLLFAFLISFAVYLLIRPLKGIRAALQTNARAKERGTKECKELAGSVNAFIRSAEKQTEQLKEISESRKLFADNMAHEMKTPLTSIMCRADLLRIKRNVSDKELRESANVIFEEATRMKALSSKLLALAETDEAGLSKEPVTVEELFEETRLAIGPVAQTMGVNLVFADEGGTLFIDRALFKTLLFNLIENALKASPEGNDVEITGTADGETVTIYVIDHGIGMSAFDLKHATEPFYRADKARSRKAGGVGLGLSLCQSIAEKHGTKLMIQSEKGVGTVIAIPLKVYREENGTGTEAEEDETPFSSEADPAYDAETKEEKKGNLE